MGSETSKKRATVMALLGKKDRRRVFHPEDETRKMNTPELKVGIVLGMPSKNCQYHGICKIEPLPQGNQDFRKLNSCQVLGRLYVDELKNLTIIFMKSSLSDKAIGIHFSEADFIILEPYEIPLSLVPFVGNYFTIQTGKYPIIESEMSYSVTFSNYNNR